MSTAGQCARNGRGVRGSIPKEEAPSENGPARSVGAVTAAGELRANDLANQLSGKRGATAVPEPTRPLT